MPRISTLRPFSSPCPTDSAEPTIARQQVARDAEQREQLVVPVQRLEVEEQRPRRVGHIDHVLLATGQPPDEEAVDCAERQPVARAVLAQQPFELGRREVRIGNKAGLAADELGVELAAALGGAPVLPDDRRRDRLAGRAVPEQRRLALVRDRDRPSARRRPPARAVGDARPDLVGVVLDPARAREVLRQLAVAATPTRSSSSSARHVVPVVPWSIARITRVAAMNSSVRRQASSESAWNSSCLRSKKLCGAPSY